MFRIVFGLFLAFVGFQVYAQTAAEKLNIGMELYESATSDTAKLRHLNKIAIHMLMKDRQKAISLAREGLVLSKIEGQEPIEIANAIYNFGYLMRYDGKSDSSILYLSKSLERYKQLNNSGKMAYVYTQLGANLATAGKSAEPIAYFDTAVRYFIEAKDTIPLIKAIGILGSLQKSAGQTDEALANGIKALDLAKLINDSISIGQELSKVAGLYYKLGNSAIAKEMFSEAIEINNQTGNKLNQYYAYSNLSTLYQGALDFDSMIWATKKSLEYLDTNARPANYTTGLVKLAQGYIEKKEYEQVLPMLQHGLAYAQRRGLTKSVVTFYRLYGYYYREIEDFKNSKAFYQKGLKIIDSTGLFFPKRYYYESLSYVYEQLGDYENAYTYERLFNKHIDSIYKIEKVKSIAEAEAKYFDEKRDLELNILKKDNEIKDRKAAKQRILFLGLFGFTILLGLLSFWVFRSYKLKQRLRIEKFRNKVAADLHDDVGSTLSSIAMYSEVIKSKTKDVLPETVPMLENMTNSSSQLIEAMSDIVWTINPKNNTFQSLLQRIREFAGELCEAKDIDFEFSQKGELVNLKLNMDASQNLYLVMKEAINNSLKYSGCNMLNLEIIKEPKKLSFAIIDDGKGFDTDNPNIGNGVTNMKERMEEIGGKLKIESGNTGTAIMGELDI